MTREELNALGLPLDMNVAENALVIESGLSWIAQNTTFKHVDGEEYPANVKLFLLKFAEVMLKNSTVVSESIGGMSQSFSTGDKAGLLLRQYAEELLGEWYSGGAVFIPAVKRYENKMAYRKRRSW